jgi:tetratricopeptide (TPR) repeat protein
MILNGAISTDFCLSNAKRGCHRWILIIMIVLCLAAPSICTTSATEQKLTASYWLQQGDKLYINNSYALAIDCYEKAIEIDPNFDEAWNNKGNSLYQLGRFKESTEDYNRALKINPINIDAWTNKGKTLRQIEKYDESLESFNKSLEINPQNADAWANKGKTLRQIGKYDESLESFNKSLEINPQNADAWADKGEALYFLSRYAHSNDAFDRALELDPANADAWANKGKALYFLSRYAHSNDAFDKALELDPANADAWEYKGLVLKKLYISNRKNESIDSYIKSIDAYNKSIMEANYTSIKLLLESPFIFKNGSLKADDLINFSEILINISEILLVFELNNKFNETYEIVLNISDIQLQENPGDVNALNNKGKALYQIGKYNESISCFNKILEEDPLDEDALEGKGRSLFKTGRYKESIDCFDKAAEMDPLNANALFYSGQAAHEQKSYDEAIKKYNGAIKIYKNKLDINPKNANAWNDMADILYDMGRMGAAYDAYNEALEIYNNELKINQQNAYAWKKRGEISGILASGAERGAFKIPESVDASNRASRALRDKSEALYEQNKTDEARESYERAINLNPSFGDSHPIWYSTSGKSTSSNSISSNPISEGFMVIVFFIILSVIIFYADKYFEKFDKASRIKLISIRIQRHLINLNFYLPIGLLKFLKFIIYISILAIPPLIISDTLVLIWIPFGILFLTIIVLAALSIGAIITGIIWLLLSPPLIPCGSRAIWIDLELQMKRKKQFNKIDNASIAYFITSGTIVLTYVLYDFIYNKSHDGPWFGILLSSWILWACFSTIFSSIIGVLYSRNLDRETAKSVFVSQFGLVGINVLWLLLLLYGLTDIYPSLKGLIGGYSPYTQVILILVPLYVFTLFIPYLEGIRRSEKRREQLFHMRQTWLDRLSDILEVPTPTSYISKLEQFLEDLERDRKEFVEKDEMVKLTEDWQNSKDPQADLEMNKRFDEHQIMLEAYQKSREMDPRFNYLDFLVSLRDHVKECMVQLKLTGQIGESELTKVASSYSKVYHSKKDEFTKLIEEDKRTKPNWTVALATIITLVLTPLLTEIGKFLSSKLPFIKP